MEESSLSIGLDDVVKIDLAVVGCVAVSPTGRCYVLCCVQFRLLIFSSIVVRMLVSAGKLSLACARLLAGLPCS